MKSVILVLAAYFLAGPCLAQQPARERLKDQPVVQEPYRRIVIDTVIRAPGILNQANELLMLIEANKDPVDIVLNSPGGAVFAGMQFINAMEAAKARGVVLKCHVVGMAASMAFQILAHCSERYALPYSLLLWHPVRVGMMGVLTPALAEQLLGVMQLIEEDMVPKIQEELSIDDETFFKHYHWETLHTGIGVNRLSPTFLFVVNDMPIAGSIWHPQKMRRSKKKPGVTVPFPSLLKSFGDDDIAYIDERAYKIWSQQDEDKDKGDEDATPKAPPADCTSCHIPHKGSLR